MHADLAELPVAEVNPLPAIHRDTHRHALDVVRIGDPTAGIAGDPAEGAAGRDVHVGAWKLQG